MTKISLLTEADDLNGDEQVVLVKDGVTRRAAVSGLVGASVSPYLAEADASAMAAALARDQAANLVLPANIFVDMPLATAEAAVSVGSNFKLVNTGSGLVDVRRRTPDGSALMYQEATAAALASKNGETIIGSDDNESGALWTNIRGFIGYLRSSFGSAIIGFLPAGVGAVMRTSQAKMRDTVSVMDFGAKGDGVNNDTPAFTAALATGKTVTVPALIWDGTEYVRAIYSVADIPVVDRMQVRGEKDGWGNAPILSVRTTGASAFLNNSDEIVFYVTIENLACRAGTGVTGASFYKQTRQDRYTAFATFRNIETHLSLQVDYIITPIFCVWDRCRSGGEGGATDVQHSFIQALALEYGQRDQLNVNRIKDCIVNNAFGTVAAVTVSYGVTWNIENTDFEAMTCSAFAGYNAEQVRFTGCWFEAVRAVNTVQLRNYPATAASSHAVFDTCNFVFNGTGGVEVVEALGIDNLSSAAVENCTFNVVPAGAKLTTTGERLTVNKNNRALSGAGAAAFFDGTHHDTYAGGRRLLNGAGYNGVPAMNLQNGGGISATEGFLSTTNQLIADEFVTIAKSHTGFGGVVRISGYDSDGGAQFRFVKDFFSGAVTDLTPAVNNTSRVFDFQVVGSDLQMKVDTGNSVRVTVTLIH